MGRRAGLLISPLLVASVLMACGGEDYDDAGGEPTTGLVTAVTTEDAGVRVTLEGEPLVAVRTLPASALSAENLEVVGTATSGAGDVQIARARSSDVAAWEYVSAGEEGWVVWRPQVVLDVLDEAGPGAELASVERVDWPNACLGAPRADEACAEVITPGYRVTVREGDDLVEYHTDLATRIRPVGVVDGP